MAKKSASFTSSVIDDKDCDYFEMENDMSCMCELCGCVTVINGCPFTNIQWIEYNNSNSHNRKVEQHKHMESIKAAKSSKGGPVSEKELLQVKDMSRTQVGIGNLLTSKRKK